MATAAANSPGPGRAYGPADSPIDYLLVGHVTVDRLDDGRVLLGGTATYAALALRNLGVRVGIHTSAGFEPDLLEVLYGTQIARVPAPYTTCFVNHYAPDGRRQQTVESVAEPLTYDQIVPAWRNPPVVHLAPLCQELDSGLVERFPNSLVGVTPQGWLRTWDEPGGGFVRATTDWPGAEQVLARADAVIISEDDLPDASLIHAWAEKARLLVVTRAECGCDVYAHGAARPYHSPAFAPAGVVDPTGAGDVFAGAFLWHLHRSGGDWQQAADWANCVASFAVEQVGPAAVPKLDAVEARWRASAERSVASA